MNNQDIPRRDLQHDLTTATEQLITLVDDALRAWHECLDASCCRN